jgi:hypothetical protein
MNVKIIAEILEKTASFAVTVIEILENEKYK